MAACSAFSSTIATALSMRSIRCSRSWIGEEPGQRLQRRSGSRPPEWPARTGCAGLSSVSFDSTGSDWFSSLAQLQSAQRELAALRRHQGPDAGDRLQESPPVNRFQRLPDRGQLARLGRDRCGLGPGPRRDAQAHQPAVGQEEQRFDGGVAHVAEQVPACADCGRAQPLEGEERVVSRDGLPYGLHAFRQGCERPHQGVQVARGPVLNALGVKHPSKLSHRLAPPSAKPGAYEHQVGPLAEFRNGRYHREGPLVTPLQLVEPTQVFQPFLLEGHGERRPPFGPLFLDPHQVKPRGSVARST